MDTYGGRSGMLALVCPAWMQGEYGLSWSAGVGDVLDVIFDGTKDAIKLRMPLQAAAAGDDQALALIGQDSSLPRYPAEARAEYGLRLQARWSRYDRAGAAPRVDGTGCPILEDLEGIGFGGITLMEYHDWPELWDFRYDSPPPVEYDSGNASWSRVWIYIEQYDGNTIPLGSVLDGSDTLDGNFSLDYTLPESAQLSASLAAQTWKPAHITVYLTYLTAGIVVSDILGIGILDDNLTLH